MKYYGIFIVLTVTLQCPFTHCRMKQLSQGATEHIYTIKCVDLRNSPGDCICNSIHIKCDYLRDNYIQLHLSLLLAPSQ